MHISYKPLWHTLVERNMRKEDLRIAAGLTTNMIANMEHHLLCGWCRVMYQNPLMSQIFPTP